MTACCTGSRINLTHNYTNTGNQLFEERVAESEPGFEDEVRSFRDQLTEAWG